MTPAALNRRINIAGQRFGFWTVELAAGISNGSRLQWWCVCDCGARRIVSGYRLRAGKSKSCGCQKGALTGAAIAVHGHARRSHRHSLYMRWRAMLGRCYDTMDKSYRNYGARGIAVCDRWRNGENGLHGYECFLADMGEPPFPRASVDRENNDGPYSPENCRWATDSQQQKNKRRRGKQ